MFKKIGILLVPFVMLIASASHGQSTNVFQKRKIVTNSTRFAVPSASVLIGRGTKPVKHANNTRFVNPNQKVNAKRLVPMKVYKYQKQGRRIGLAELRKRLYALENGKQSRARRTGDKPTSQNNPELKSICNQLSDLMDLIAKEMQWALLTERDAEFAELQLLYNKAKSVARRIGCGGKYLIPKLQGQVINKVKAKK